MNNTRHLNFNREHTKCELSHLEKVPAKQLCLFFSNHPGQNRSTVLAKALLEIWSRIAPKRWPQSGSCLDPSDLVPSLWGVHVSSNQWTLHTSDSDMIPTDPARRTNTFSSILGGKLRRQHKSNLQRENLHKAKPCDAKIERGRFSFWGQREWVLGSTAGSWSQNHPSYSSMVEPCMPVNLKQPGSAVV